MHKESWNVGLTKETDKRVLKNALNIKKAHIEGAYTHLNYKDSNNPNWKGGPLSVECINCGKIFSVSRGRYNADKPKFCSKTCWGLFKSRHIIGASHPSWNPHNKVIIQCAVCGKEKEVYRCQRKTKIPTCSRICASQLSKTRVYKSTYPERIVPKKTVFCSNCDKEKVITLSKYNRSSTKMWFCNSKCMGLWMSKYRVKENNPCYKGGAKRKNLTRPIMEVTNEYKEWRLMVFGRDNFTCQMCNKRGGYVQAHHIKTYNKFPELRLLVFNGITLCIDCHNKTKCKEEKYEDYFYGIVKAKEVSFENVSSGNSVDLPREF